MILAICEKPSQARDIARHLKATQRKPGYFEGQDYQVTWCLGHLLELAPPDYYRPDIKPWHIDKLPVIPKPWTLQVVQKTKKQWHIIRRLLQTTQQVLIASDPDREGECIVRNILEACHYQGTIKRLWLSALDDTSIQKALQTIKPGKATENLYQAALARSRGDFLIGMNLTMGASALYGVNRVLSIGRVQTPTLKLVVDRDRTIEQFKTQPYFVLKIRFSDNKHPPFWTTWQAPEDCLDPQGHCLNQLSVASIAAKVDQEPGVVSQQAPLCLALSTLQQTASRAFGYSAKHTADMAQLLYDTYKAITYPRTDCRYLPQAQWKEAPQVLDTLTTIDPTLRPLLQYCDSSIQSSVWDDTHLSAHHAIIPTLNTAVDIHVMPKAANHIYDLIRRYYIAQFMGHYSYQQRGVDIQCAGELLTAISNTPIKLGWKHALLTSSLKSNDKQSQPTCSTIPVLKPGDIVNNHNTVMNRQYTQPPARFTEGTLIEAMKMVGQSVDDQTLKKRLKASQGIGTEATRANIIEILLKRGYLQRHSKHMLSTKRGRALIDLVPDLVKNPVLTAQWEQQLEAIAKGAGQVDDFLSAQIQLLKAMLKQLQQVGPQKKAALLQLQSDTQDGKVYLCPHCECPLKQLRNKTGQSFWGCSQYPHCRFTTGDRSGKPHL